MWKRMHGPHCRHTPPPDTAKLLFDASEHIREATSSK